MCVFTPVFTWIITNLFDHQDYQDYNRFKLYKITQSWEGNITDCYPEKTEERCIFYIDSLLKIFWGQNVELKHCL